MNDLHRLARLPLPPQKKEENVERKGLQKIGKEWKKRNWNARKLVVSFGLLT